MVIIELPLVLRIGLAAYMIAGFIERVGFLMHLRMIVFVHQIYFFKITYIIGNILQEMCILRIK